MTNNAAARLRDVQISNWRTHENKTLRGFFTVTLPSGMVINDCMLHRQEDRRWIGLPAREYKGQGGDRKFAPLVSFVDRAAEIRFQAQVLSALDREKPWEAK